MISYRRDDDVFNILIATRFTSVDETEADVDGDSCNSLKFGSKNFSPGYKCRGRWGVFRWNWTELFKCSFLIFTFTRRWTKRGKSVVFMTISSRKCTHFTNVKSFWLVTYWIFLSFIKCVFLKLLKSTACSIATECTEQYTCDWLESTIKIKKQKQQKHWLIYYGEKKLIYIHLNPKYQLIVLSDAPAVMWSTVWNVYANWFHITHLLIIAPNASPNRTACVIFGY